MASWFCSNLCLAENQNMSEIVLVSNQAQTTYQYGKSIQRNKLMALENGFIMLKKSLYEQYLTNCQKNKTKFTDQEFPPNMKSISEGSLDQFPELKNKTIIWKRIPDIYENCELIREKIEPADIQQGNIGDCYFLSAISALSQNQNNILQIFQKKDPKSMLKNQYSIYKLVINRAGQPQQIIIDDYIPVHAKSERPVFCKPVNNQFWVVLLQKAWAKINKSYRNIAFGNPHEVLNRFSVAPVFYQDIPVMLYQSQHGSKQTFLFQQNLWQQIKQGHLQNFPMCCGSRSQVLAEGIKPKHAYTLLAAYQLQHLTKKIRLLKLRNPWGHTEYAGSFSENDSFWNSVDLKTKNQILDKNQNDGVFIIPFDAFLRNFQSIDISHSRPDYNYIFNPVSLNGSEASFYRVTVEKQGQVYLTFEMNLQRSSIQNRYEAAGVSKILIAEEAQNNKFEFVDCGLETSLADVTVRCKRLKPGSYIVMISNEDIQQQAKQSLFLSKFTKSGTLSTYSNSICSIEQLPEVKNFNSQFFYTHAIKYNKEKKKIGSYEESWIAKKLIQSSGYGYICISSDARDTKLFSITIIISEIQKAGFKLEIPAECMNSIISFDPARIEMQLRPGQVLTFLFRINFKRQNLTFSFPPAGFDVKRII